MRKDPEKTSIGDRNRARCVTGAHATACPTEVDTFTFTLLQIMYWEEQNSNNYGANLLMNQDAFTDYIESLSQNLNMCIYV